MHVQFSPLQTVKSAASRFKLQLFNSLTWSLGKWLSCNDNFHLSTWLYIPCFYFSEPSHYSTRDYLLKVLPTNTTMTTWLLTRRSWSISCCSSWRRPWSSSRSLVTMTTCCWLSSKLRLSWITSWNTIQKERWINHYLWQNGQLCADLV